MSIVLVFCFVVLMIVIRRRKGQSIPLEKFKALVKIEWGDVPDGYHQLTPEDYKQATENLAQHLDVTEEQRTGDETV